ncbi:MAG: bifunctional serine/threonine-protein kinase/formylglycine-generating enzyme family protein [Planctomycetota bacterium]|nr:bifunctional serine/threonine-protein kinase/formylglycine-generating enzyme family protein [Planctomycetota bacterium]
MIPSELAGHSRYEVLEPLGAGGMGAVYKAKHRLMDRVVAIKTINPLLVSQPGAVERFIREVKAAAQLIHPNIVTAYDAEKIGETHVLVMEYVEGETLGELLDEQGVLRVSQACDYVRQTALGLQHALDCGMVHRDIKPLNLMLTKQGAVKILDFGLARFVSEERPLDGSTEQGSIMGSPDYMAPEQARDAHTADARADIYSMGCTLYQLLAGQVPFPGRALLEKMEAHRDQQPLALNQLRVDVPAELEKIIATMMAKDSAQRYQTPAEVAEALRPFTQIQPVPILAVTKHPTPAVERKPKSKSKSKIPMAIAVAAALLLAAIGYRVAQVVLRVETPQGTLIVTTDDPEVQVSVKSGGKEVAMFFPKEKKEVPLRIGEYTLELVGGQSGAKLSTNKFEIKSGSDKKTVTVEFLPTVAEDSPKKTGKPSTLPAALGFPFSAEEGQESQRAWATFLKRPVIEKNSLDMKLALIPPGEFPMTPEYRVRLTKPSYLGVHQVTVGQFRQFVKETGYKTDCERSGGGVVYRVERKPMGANAELIWSNEQKVECIWSNRDFSPTDEHPVVFVSWTDAVKFCSWLSLKEKKDYRLPTVAEWEWASRGGAVRDAKTMQARGWFAVKSKNRSQPVGGLPADVFGLCDMFGNVHEHCHDWNGPHPEGLLIDPQGPPEGDLRVQRSGSFLHTPDEYVYPFSDWRIYVPNMGTNGCGFRVACNVASPASTIFSSTESNPTAEPTLVPAAAKDPPKKTGKRTNPPAPLAFPFSAEEGQKKQQEWAEHLNRKVVETNSGGMKLALIPPGEFPMTPEYRVRLTKPFYLGAHAVTVGQFRQFVKETGYRTDSEAHGGGGLWNEKGFIEQKAEYVWDNRDFSPTDEHPVVFVSWTDAKRFCAWLSLKEKKNYRLPTEAEWEWASRGGAVRDAKTMQARGWFAAKSGKRSKPVGMLPADVFGLFDMFGNCQDLCHDWGGPNPNGLLVDPTGPTEGQNRVVRGGSYILTADDFAEPRSDWRWFAPNTAGNGFGFRVACDVAPPQSKPPFAWPADALREGRITAPDLSKVKPRFDDDFADRRSGWQQGKRDPDKDGWSIEYGYNKGKYFIQMPTAAGGGGVSNPLGKEHDYVVRAVGRLASPEAENWHLSLETEDKIRNVAVWVRSNGKLDVEFRGEGWSRSRPFPPFSHFALKQPEAFNALTVVVRDQTMELYVNDIAVCDPIVLEQSINPGVIWLGIGGDKGARIEFERVSIWSAEALPTPEERLKNGDVPVKQAPRIPFARPADTNRGGN